MAGTHELYSGGDYGFESPKFDDYSAGMGNYKVNAGTIGFTTDPRTANQLNAVSLKLNTGAKVVEMQGLTPDVLDYIPKQHFKEIARLKQLTGSEFTFHGPLVEPTGVSKQGWDESDRMQAQRQIWSAVERAQALDEKGNLVITFHTSNGLPDPLVKVKDEKGNEKVTDMWVVDERDGRFSSIKPQDNFLAGKEFSPQEELKKHNEETWSRALTHVSFNAHNGLGSLSKGIQIGREGFKEEEETKNVDFVDMYKKLRTEEGKKFVESMTPRTRKFAEHALNEIDFGYTYVKDSYNELQNIFNKAWESARKDGNEEDKAKLKEFRTELSKVFPKGDDFDDPSKAMELAEEVVKGVRVINTLSSTPKTFRPLRDFAIDKASETFSNVALQAYDKFKDNAPIISIENPPAGMGLARAQDLKELIEASRKKLTQKLMDENKFDEKKAKYQAEKLIGATWDVGHINMIRKHGYTEEDVIKETEKIAPFVKHVHLSDNFGMEHTELPMGMGNVPTKPMLEAIEQYNKQVKKIVEVGGWYQHFKYTPFKETLSAFGSPVYAMKMGPSWNQAGSRSGGYFRGYGTIFPDYHFSTYGGGFSTLPPELGGQMGGRSRLSGAPTE